MAHIVASKEVPFGALQPIIDFVSTNYDDQAFAQLLDGCWRPYRLRENLYEFAGQRFLFDEYQYVGRPGAYALQIWMHDRPGNRLVLQIRNAARFGFVEISLVDVDHQGCGLPEMLDMMWQEDVESGLEETLGRFAAFVS